MREFPPLRAGALNEEQPEECTNVKIEGGEVDVLHDEGITPLPRCQVTTVFEAAESGPCGGVQMALRGLQGVYNLYSGSNNRVGLNANMTNGADSTAAAAEKGIVTGVQAEAVQNGDVVMVSAHGNPVFRDEAERNGAEVFDATCPFVRRTHNEIREVATQMKKEEEQKAEPVRSGILFLSLGGSTQHPEFVGSSGLADSLGIPFISIHNGNDIAPALEKAQAEGLRRLRIVSQTTNDAEKANDYAAKIVEEIADKYPDVDIKSFAFNVRDVCRTVTDRQEATRMMVENGVETLVVVGSVRSKNTRSLIKVAVSAEEKLRTTGRVTHLKRIILANSHHQVPDDIEGIVGVVSGASTLRDNINGVVTKLNGPPSITVGGSDSNRHKPDFFLPVDSHEANQKILRELVQATDI